MTEWVANAKQTLFTRLIAKPAQTVNFIKPINENAN